MRKQQQYTSTLKSHPNDSFFRQARELRDMIYEYLVVNDEPIELTNCKLPTACISTNIFLVCREITEECEEVFYRKNSFVLGHPGTATDAADIALYQRLKLRGNWKKIHLIRDMTINIPHVPSERTAQQLKEQGLLNHLKLCVHVIKTLRPEMNQLRLMYNGIRRDGRCVLYWPHYSLSGPFQEVIKNHLKVEKLELIVRSKYGQYCVRERPERVKEELRDAMSHMLLRDRDVVSMGWQPDCQRDLSAYIAARKAERDAEREAMRQERRSMQELLSFVG